MTNNNEARISLTLDAYFPGTTNKIPSDVVSSLNNITLKVTTIVVSHILIKTSGVRDLFLGSGND